MRESRVETTLGEVAEIRIGRTPPRNIPRYWTDRLDRPFLTIAEMDGGAIRPHREGVTKAAETEGKVKRVPAGSLLMSFKLTIGRVGFAAVDVFPNEAIAWLEPRSRNLDKHFLGVWLAQADLLPRAGRAVKGNTLNSESLRSIPVALPPLAEQRRIVDLISSIDAVSAECERQIAAARALRMSLLTELISVPVRTGRWPAVELGQLARLSLGFTKGHRTGSLVDVPYLRAANLYFGELRLDDVARIAVLPAEAEKHRLKAGDVLLTEGGSPWDLGRGWLWEGQIVGCIHQNSVIRAAGFVPDVNPRFVAHALETTELRQYFESRAAQTSGVAHLGKGGASLAPIPLPSRPVQDRIVALLDAVLATAQEARQVSASLSRLRQGVVHDLISGDRSIPASYDRFLAGAA
jgi:type I restriction enzyme S subunit